MYKRGTDNAAVDALSRLLEISQEVGSTQLQELTSVIETDWADRLEKENQTDPWIRDALEKIASGDFDTNYTVRGGILYFQGCFCDGPTSDL